MMRSKIILVLSLFSICTWADSQIQPQVKTMVIFSPGITNSSCPVVGTNPDLSYQLLNNEHGVGTELTILKAQENGEICSPVTAGGMIQVDSTVSQQPLP